MTMTKFKVGETYSYAYESSPASSLGKFTITERYGQHLIGRLVTHGTSSVEHLYLFDGDGNPLGYHGSESDMSRVDWKLQDNPTYTIKRIYSDGTADTSFISYDNSYYFWYNVKWVIIRDSYGVVTNVDVNAAKKTLNITA